MTAPVLVEARARIAAAFPAWSDASGDPHNRPAATLPWFAVSCALGEAERMGMGSARLMRSGDLVIALGLPVPDAGSAREAAHAAAAAVTAALAADPPDLGGLVWSLLPSGEEVTIEAGEARIARADLSFAIQLVG